MLRRSIPEHEANLIHYGGAFLPDLIKSAQGCYLTTVTGKRILDFTSGQMCATLGHNHPRIVEAVGRAGTLAYHLFSGMLHESVPQLATRLVDDWMPENMNRVIFVNTGSESNEVALRIAKLYTGGYEVLAVGGSWHGVTSGASSLTFAGDARRRYGVPVPGVYALPEPNNYRPYISNCSSADSALESLEIGLKLFDMSSTGHPAAIIIEPVISAGGILVPPREYMLALRKAADDRGMLLIYDEAQTAFGRLGYRHGADYFGITPDIITVSKTLGGGLPIAATITTDRIADTVEDRGFSYYTSHVSDPLGCIVALEVLNILQEGDIVSKAKETGKYLYDGLFRLQSEYEVIGDIRGVGMLLGIELVTDRKTKEPALLFGQKATQKAYSYGLSMNIKEHPERGAIWRIAPPLTAAKEDIDTGLTIMERSIKECLEYLS